MFKILFRADLQQRDELEVARQYFEVYENRAQIQPGDVILGRYSVLPFYKELQQDCIDLGAKLLISPMQHQYIASIWNWYQDLAQYTPHTWFDSNEVFLYSKYPGPFFAKGKINSKKRLWKTHAYAKDRNALKTVIANLQDDDAISEQGIVVRAFEEFNNYGLDIIGRPITDEYRCFIFNRRLIASGFYWSNQVELIESANWRASEIDLQWLQEVIAIVSETCPHFVVDIAKKGDKWRVVELNDFQMSGLSTIDAHLFYAKLKEAAYDFKN